MGEVEETGEKDGGFNTAATATDDDWGSRWERDGEGRKDNKPKAETAKDSVTSRQH